MKYEEVKNKNGNDLKLYAICNECLNFAALFWVLDLLRPILCVEYDQNT